MDPEIIHILDQPAAVIYVNQDKPSDRSEGPDASQMESMQEGQDEEDSSIPITEGEGIN